MTKNLIILSSLLLFACTNKPPIDNNTSSSIITDEVKTEEEDNSEEKPVEVNFTNLTSKVFDGGSRHLFIDSTCSFYFACDCCADKLIFNTDSTFYEISMCESDESFRTGRYTLSESTLTLNYSEVCIRNEYNWENEFDTSAIDYFIKDTIVEKHSLSYTSMVFCKDKLTFSRKFKGNQADEYLITLSVKNYTEEIEKLANIGFLQMLK